MKTALDKLAGDLVGDCKKPNMFFVSDEKGKVLTVTIDFDTAYAHYNSLPNNKEKTLEDRKHGVVCSVEPSEDGKRLVSMDDSRLWRFQK